MAESDPAPSQQGRTDGASRRGAKRDSFLLLTSISDEQGRPLGRARVRNLSATGLMAVCAVRFSEGQRVVVDLRGVGLVSGAVTWMRGERMGIAFDRQIDPRAARWPVDENASMDYLRPLPRRAMVSR